MFVCSLRHLHHCIGDHFVSFFVLVLVYFRFVLLVGSPLRHGRLFLSSVYPVLLTNAGSILMHQRRFSVVFCPVLFSLFCPVSLSPGWMGEGGGYRRSCSCCRCPMSKRMGRLCIFFFARSITRRPLHAAAASCFVFAISTCHLQPFPLT